MLMNSVVHAIGLSMQGSHSARYLSSKNRSAAITEEAFVTTDKDCKWGHADAVASNSAGTDPATVGLPGLAYTEKSVTVFA